MSRFLVSAVAILSCVLMSSVVKAAPAGPIVGIEQVNETLSPTNSEVTHFYPNYFDPFHVKHLSFEGAVETIQPNPNGEPSIVTIWFDWVDLTGGIATTPPRTVGSDPIPGGSRPFLIEEGIPFCPQEVSLHMQLENEGAVVVRGTFTHICDVPLPSAAWAGMALLGSVGVARVIRRRAVKA